MAVDPHTLPTLQVSPGQHGAISDPDAVSRQPAPPDGLQAAGNGRLIASNSALVMQRLVVPVEHMQVPPVPSGEQLRVEPSQPGPEVEQEVVVPPPPPTLLEPPPEPPVPPPVPIGASVRIEVNRQIFFASTELQHSSPARMIALPQKTPCPPPNVVEGSMSLLGVSRPRLGPPQQNFEGLVAGHVPTPRATHAFPIPPPAVPHWLLPPYGVSSQQLLPSSMQPGPQSIVRGGQCVANPSSGVPHPH